MIRQKEVATVAEQQGVAKTTIDKDWALGHFVDAIFSIPVCREQLVFKGGTCLKKCYFPNYRFSEDLDFTAVNADFRLDEKLLTEIMRRVTERTAMSLHLQQLKVLRHQERPTGFAATVKFWGADHPRNQPPPPPHRWRTSIKIETISYETMVFPIEERPVHHAYSDALSPAAERVPCYSLSEVLAEKLRALIQRSYTAPRDFYDIWYLAHRVPDLDWPAITTAFHQKVKFKGLIFTGLLQMINDENDKRLQAAWKNSLSHQIPGDKLPEYSRVRTELAALIKKIFTSA
ncbi:nucleotidyl transferase AbiEii/AbiGii toxin family protein [Tunicatimonas pelagia]|uniref:nucleotidyl transferase AbiEii/AbiGii toxin family protein n=1 Tax=Tunicatimonas pelagia TaxID=931531 RepID=UPI002666A448|nr:nucleotidyl transferase AbiEii/AbiGii toxin family protein [Tunicatimonas pelagia]WKN44914.1 nucleotidyl transferase AbiEii/AbiGii toxin family protein [Tunicatimonas pelagia]